MTVEMLIKRLHDLIKSGALKPSAPVFADVAKVSGGDNTSVKWLGNEPFEVEVLLDTDGGDNLVMLAYNIKPPQWFIDKMQDHSIIASINFDVKEEDL